MEHLLFEMVRTALHACGPPGPSDLVIDYSDGDSVVYAAGILDYHGEWEAALALYTLAADLLRGQQDGVYAANRAKEVREKLDRLHER